MEGVAGEKEKDDTKEDEIEAKEREKAEEERGGVESIVNERGGQY